MLINRHIIAHGSPLVMLATIAVCLLPILIHRRRHNYRRNTPVAIASFCVGLLVLLIRRVFTSKAHMP